MCVLHSMKQIVQQKQKQQSKYEEYAYILETTQYNQIRGVPTDGINGRCALAILGSSRYKYLSENIRQRIYEMNDYENKSFKEIAEWLREQK
jgi:hypothetical protein